MLVETLIKIRNGVEPNNFLDQIILDIMSGIDPVEAVTMWGYYISFPVFSRVCTAVELLG